MKKIVLACVVAATVLVVVIGFLYMLRKYQQSKVRTPNSVELLSTVEHRLICVATSNFSEANLLGVGSFGSVYRGMLSDGTDVAVKILNLQVDGAFRSFDAECQELCVATSNFSENLLGVGSFGSVYRGMLSDGTDVAVKILNLQVDGAFRSFDAECQVLRTVRHRNLVKVISSCSNPESEPIVHCDLKPSNVLLDEDMVAHLGDFGISKILVENRIATQAQTLATLGYVSPEYGLEGRVSMKCDIYSYGMMLLEIFTRKRPTDEMFAGELSLRQLVKGSLPNSVVEAVDGNLLRLIEVSENMIAYLLLILEVGLEYCAELLEERINIKDVFVFL
ncbi:probable LRR receptor-like serine/threonine-protein kinase At3g47570 [Camellia sinensis]|uniref:probable LRR receptor-like serine/threonine-protein kinase At3g47570 n=1 Tax=Camellia sinensis TaxID=4442 RepID=UPI001036C706|nr:probable LRR receptor-like serine/threonine-protein kinase At3g47570 [Camellia sinensis]